jgi:hypothetical protein
MFRTHKYRLVGEADELENRKKYREATGMKNPRPSVQLLKTANSPSDKKGTGKGKGKHVQQPWKSNTPAAVGPDHDDEWLIVDDESPVPQAVSSVLAAHAPVQGFSAFNMSDHALGCLCMTCEALRRQASSNHFTNGQTHNADGRPFIAYVPPLRDPLQEPGPRMFRPRDVDQGPEDPVDSPHTGDFQAETAVIEVPCDSESAAGNEMSEKESHAGDPRESVPSEDIRETGSDSARSQSYVSPRSQSYRTPILADSPNDSTPSPCWCEHEAVRLLSEPRSPETEEADLDTLFADAHAGAAPQQAPVPTLTAIPDGNRRELFMNAMVGLSQDMGQAHELTIRDQPPNAAEQPPAVSSRAELSRHQVISRPTPLTNEPLNTHVDPPLNREPQLPMRLDVEFDDAVQMAPTKLPGSQWKFTSRAVRGTIECIDCERKRQDQAE